MKKDKPEKEKGLRLLGRKCPVCHVEIKKYVLCGVYIPLEFKGLYFCKNFSKGTNVELMELGFESNSEVYSLYFLNECICGYTSFWTLTNEEINFLLNNNKGYSMQWIYKREIWEQYLKNAGTDVIKKSIKETLKMINEVYPQKEK